MPAAAGLTMTSYLWFCLKWNLLFAVVFVAGGLLLKAGYPLVILPLLVLFGVFFWRDAARVSRAMRGRIVRRVGGYAEPPRSLRSSIICTLVTVVLCYLLLTYGGYVLLAVLGAGVVSWLMRPLAIRYGWFEEGRISARFHRPRFIDERFRRSVDPTGRA